MAELTNPTGGTASTQTTGGKASSTVITDPKVSSGSTTLTDQKPADSVDQKPADSVDQKPADSVDQKPADSVGQKPVDTVPEKYEFTLPEGYELSEAMYGEFSTVAKEFGLGKEKAQKLVDLAAKQMKGYVDSQTELVRTTREGWIKDLKDDKDYGRGKFDETLERAKRVYRKFGDEFGVKEILENSGVGDHKGLIVMLSKIDKAMGEDWWVDGGKSQTGLSAAETLFGKDGRGPTKSGG